MPTSSCRAYAVELTRSVIGATHSACDDGVATMDANSGTPSALRGDRTLSPTRRESTLKIPAYLIILATPSTPATPPPKPPSQPI